MNKYTELEFKYNADEVGLDQFKKLMEQIGYKKTFDVSSWDHYYTKEDTDDFMRFRDSPITPELTIKRKTNNSNNWNRIEIDLPLDINRVNKEVVAKFVGLEGYQEDFKIYKSCFMYFQEYYNCVYYIVYDQEMREKNRFIEIEVNKDAVESWDVEALGEPETYLRAIEKNLEALGISNKNRLKKSLFELYRG